MQAIFFSLKDRFLFQLLRPKAQMPHLKVKSLHKFTQSLEEITKKKLSY